MYATEKTSNKKICTVCNKNERAKSVTRCKSCNAQYIAKWRAKDKCSPMKKMLAIRW